MKKLILIFGIAQTISACTAEDAWNDCMNDGRNEFVCAFHGFGGALIYQPTRNYNQ